MEIEEIELTESELLEAIKTSGLNKSFQAYIQKYSDQRVSGALKTHQSNLDKKDLSDQERIQSLETELKEMKAGKAKGDLDTLVKAELKKEGLSEGLLKYVKVDDPGKVGESVKTLKEDITNLQQEELDIKLKEGVIPSKGETIKVDSAIEKFIENKNAGKTGGPFEGKESPENKGD